FLKNIQSGFGSFKGKIEWAHSNKRKLIDKSEYDAMEQIRLIRNDQIHTRPTIKRMKYRYFDNQLMTQAGIARLFTDTNRIVLRLRSMSSSREKWPVIPPGYAKEKGWDGDK
ncbi:MAG TPA: hypothetical protein VGQ60_03150, partial [Nitrospiraceae bacterium]|nr:hypothetical protein [Nitrospiraceae bacterium]